MSAAIAAEILKLILNLGYQEIWMYVIFFLKQHLMPSCFCLSKCSCLICFIGVFEQRVVVTVEYFESSGILGAND